MSDISITRSHQLSAESLRALAESLVGKLQSRHGGEFRWENDHCVHYQHGSNAEARVEFDDSELHIAIKLSKLLSLMKPLIESEIKRSLDEYLNQNTA